MPRVPSRHGLEKKYRPWRKGKGGGGGKGGSGGSDPSSSSSGNANGAGADGGGKTTGALGSRLRSQRRLLSKISSTEKKDINDDDKNDASDASAKAASMKTKIESNIAEIQALISARNSADRERKNAARYRGVRFVERKKLLRMERKVRGEMADAVAGGCDEEEISALREELKVVARDQLYVALYPNDARYISLFAAGGGGGGGSDEEVRRRPRDYGEEG